MPGTLVLPNPSATIVPRSDPHAELLEPEVLDVADHADCRDHPLDVE
jgi:hypothetical protein